MFSSKAIITSKGFFRRFMASKQQIPAGNLSPGIVADPFKQMSSYPSLSEFDKYFRFKMERFKGHIETTKASIDIAKFIPSFKSMHFGSEAEKIYRGASSAFLHLNAAELRENLTEPYYQIMRQGLRPRRGAKFAVKLHDFVAPSIVRQMRIVPALGRTDLRFAQVTVCITSLKVPILIDGKVEMKLPEETTMENIRNLPIYNSQIDPMSGEWRSLVDDNDATTIYYHSSSREVCQTVPKQIRDPSLTTREVSAISAGLGGSESDTVTGYVHENYVVFEHPLFASTSGWKIAKF